MAKRTLADLYRPGREVTIYDEDGEAFGTFWLQKPSATDTQDCFDRAATARAKSRARYSDRNSDEYLAITIEYRDLEREDLVEIAIAPKFEEFSRKAEARILHAEESEWTKDDYLHGLMAAWGEGGREAYAADKEDPEASKIYEELKRYESEVQELVGPWSDAYRESLTNMPLPDLVDLVATEGIKNIAEKDWIDAYRDAQIAVSLFGQDRRKKIFNGVNRPADGGPKDSLYVSDLAPQTKHDLRAEIEALEVGVTEGKDSPPAASSSTSSDDTETAEA